MKDIFILIIGCFGSLTLGFLICFLVIKVLIEPLIESLIDLVNEDVNNYYILDENIVFVDDNTVKTYVVMNQTNDYLVVSDCLIDINKNKIIIDSSTTTVLKNLNIHIIKINFKSKEFKRNDFFEQIKNSDKLNNNEME